MKAKLVYFAVFLSLFFMQTNILASQTLDDTEAIQAKVVGLKQATKEAESKKSVKSSSVALDEIIYSEINNMSDLSKTTVSLKNNNYYFGNKLVKNSLVTKTESSNSIVLKYCAGGVCVSSAYKKIDKDKGYAHEKNTYITSEYINTENSNKKEKFTSTLTYLFDYDVSKYKKTNDLVGGNGTDNYRVKRFSEKMNVNVVELITETIYQKKDRKLSHYNYAEMLFKEKNKVMMTVKVYATRYNNNTLKHRKVYTYDAAKRMVGYQYATFIKNQYDPLFGDTKTVKETTYDSKKRITRHEITETTKNRYYTKHLEYKSYHKNGKLKRRTIYKRNTKDKLTKSTKVNYRTNGKRSNYKKRTYKKGIVNRQYYYQYNKYGLLKTGAKRTTITYNKKGKAIKANVAKYNKKGKLTKGKIIKVTKNNKKW